MKAILILVLWLPLAVGCKKKDPEPQLPPATQTGANTFGCLVNGQLWLPEGKPNFFSSNLYVNYNPPSYRGGGVGVIAHKYKKGEVDQILSVGVDSVVKYGIATYQLKCIVSGPYSSGGIGNFEDYIRNCDYFCNRDGAILLNGTCRITKFSLPDNVVAGTFAFTLAKPGCDTIKVTDGRFDMKLY